MSVKLVIFDLDGTLLNTIEDLASSVNYALEKFDYPTHSIEKYKTFVGNGITKLLERAMPKEVCTDEMVQKLQNEFVKYYNVHSRDFTKPYDGIEEMIDDLKRVGLTLAVASNKYHQATVEVVGHYFEKNTFDVVYGKRDGVCAKPDPQIVFDIIEQCKVLPNEVLYVGDSGIDMMTAKNASLRSVGVTWGFRTKEELQDNGANHIIDTPKELLNLI